MTYRLLGADGRPYSSTVPGALGGHRRSRIYGGLDCPSALRWLARGHYARHRVFFADEVTARAAGYRPCAVCLPEAYREWRAHPSSGKAVDDPDDGTWRSVHDAAATRSSRTPPVVEPARPAHGT